MKKILIVLSVLLLSACSMLNVVDDVFIEEYLNNKYGDDITFTKMYSSSCKIYEVGTCRASYTSSVTGDNEIHIIWNEEDGSDMRDDFLFLKYDKELKDYYTYHIKNVISSNFKISSISNKSDYLWKENLIFEKFIKYENLNSGISINLIDYEGDLTNLADKIKAYFNSKDIRNIASLYITSYKKGCNLDDVSNCTKINSIYYEVKIVEFYDENEKKS